MADPTQILATITSNPARLEQLREGVAAISERTGHPLSVTTVTRRHDVLSAIPGAEVLLTYRYDPELHVGARRLKWIHFGAAGVDHSIFPELLTSDLAITLSKGIHADVMAEFAMMAILGLAVGLPRIVDSQHRKAWISKELRPGHQSVRGRRLLVLGLGAIGLPAAQMAAGLGMRVTGIRRTPLEGSPPAGLETVGTLDDLEGLLGAADYLLLALPATPLTVGLLDERRLRMLPPDGGIVNIARGSLLDEEALYRVLEDGHLRGAVLDCFQTELEIYARKSLSPGGMEAVLAEESRVIEQFCGNLELWLREEPVPYPIDREAGY